MDQELKPVTVGKGGVPLGEREGDWDWSPEALENREIVKVMVKVKERDREKVVMADWLGVVDCETVVVREGGLDTVNIPLLVIDWERERVTEWEVEGDFVGVAIVVKDIVAEAPWVKDR